MITSLCLMSYSYSLAGEQRFKRRFFSIMVFLVASYFLRADVYMHLRLGDFAASGIKENHQAK